MPLTPDEEKKLREEIRKKLEEREKRILEQKKHDEDAKLNHLEERLRAKIKEEEEEKYFRERGYVKYKNRHNEIEWLLPEEAEKRKNSRRTSRPGSHHHRKKKRLRNIIIDAVIVVVTLMVVAFIYKYNPVAAPKIGSLFVDSDITGASVFVDGEELSYFTPDTLPKLSKGRHFVTVYKEGYSTFPPMQAITISAKKMSSLSFQLKNTSSMAVVKLRVNQTNYQLFVDGRPFKTEKNGIAHLPYGYHTVMAVKPGFLAKPSYQKVLVSEDDTTFVEFNLIPSSDISYLQVSDNLYRGSVYLDKKYSGIEARGDMLPVAAGTYELSVRENGFISEPESQLIELKPGERRLVVFLLRPAEKSQKINVRSARPGAAVVLDGKVTPYVTPVRGINVSPGTHFLNLVRDNRQYSALDERILIKDHSSPDYRFEF